MASKKAAVNAWIDKILYSECKIEAIRRDITLSEFVTNALSFYIKEGNKVNANNDIEIS